jgi:hypothetical protein
LFTSIDKYSFNDGTIYGINKPSAPQIRFNSYIFDLNYNYETSEHLSLTPRLTYTQNAPWQCLDKNYVTPTYLDKWSERHMASLTMNYQISLKINSIMEFEFYIDRGFAGDSIYFSCISAKKKNSLIPILLFLHR